MKFLCVIYHCFMYISRYQDNKSSHTHLSCCKYSELRQHTRDSLSETKLQSEGKSKPTLVWALQIDVSEPAALDTLPLPLGSDYLQTKILLLYCSLTSALSAEWCNSLQVLFFFLCLSEASDDTRWINAIFLPFQVTLSVVGSIQPFNTSPPLVSCLFFRRARGFYFSPLSS